MPKRKREKVPPPKRKREKVSPKRTIIDCGDTLKIELSNAPGKFTIISKAKYHLVENCALTLTGGYVHISHKSLLMPLSHLLTGRPLDTLVKDHINIDPLDNTDENLRDATRSQNLQNKKKKPNCSSKFIGVCYLKQTKKWTCTIRRPKKAGRKQQCVKQFENEVDAARQYDFAALFYYGICASRNYLLTLEEIEFALNNQPVFPVDQQRVLPMHVFKAGNKYIVQITNADGQQSYYGTFNTVEEAKKQAITCKKKIEDEKMKRLLQTPITRNEDGQAYIVLNRQAPPEKQLHVLVDEQIWHDLEKYGWNWTQKKRTYPKGAILEDNDFVTINLHKYVWRLLHPDAPVPEDLPIDHISGNLLDCRQANLKLLSHSANLHKKRKQKGSSAFTGVRRRSPKSKFCAQIKVEGKQKHLGTFATEEEANQAYKTAARKYYPACYEHEKQ